jgi:hypothetical protein
MSSIFLADQWPPRLRAQTRGGGVAGSQPMSTSVQLYTGAQIKFGDPTPCLTYECKCLPTQRCVLCSRNCALRSFYSSSSLPSAAYSYLGNWSHRPTAQLASSARESEPSSPHSGTQPALRISVYLLFLGCSPLLADGTDQFVTGGSAPGRSPLLKVGSRLRLRLKQRGRSSLLLRNRLRFFCLCCALRSSRVSWALSR